MSQQDRGAYTPQTDAPLAFDARAPRGARRPLPMALIGSGVVLLVLIAAVVMYYRSGVRTPAAGAAAVGQPVTTVKTAPAASAKDDDPFSNLDVYAAQNVPATPAAKPAFTAPPEEPKARPEPKAAEAKPPGLKVTVDTAAVHAVPATPAAQPPAAAVAAAPVKPAAGPAAPSVAAPPSPAAAGPAAVQIGAYSSAALADKGYQEVAAAFPTFMGGKTKKVEPLERDGKMLFRTSVSGFASHSSAQAFCAALKASGHVCLVKG